MSDPDNGTEAPDETPPADDVDGGEGDPPQGREESDGPSVGEGESAPDPVVIGGSHDGDEPSESEEVDTDDNNRRRLLILALLALLAVIGGGFGTFVLDNQPDDGPEDALPGRPVTPGPNATGNVSLMMPEGATMLRTAGVVPGDTGTSQLVLRNVGQVSGDLAITAITVESDEDGIMSAESPVDDSPNQGELAEHLEVQLSVRYSDGDSVSVYGGDEYVPLASLSARNQTIGDGLASGEEAVVVFDWRLPEDTTNEVQSDTARFDVVFSLRSTNETASG